MSKSNNVTFQRQDFAKSSSEWSVIEDVCAGEKKIKSRGEKYLPKPNPSDTSRENSERYKQYLARAVFYGATGRTLQGLVGAIFRKTPILKVSNLDYLKKDADGAGVSIYQQSQKAVSEVLKKGRHALFVDYPRTGASVSKRELEDGGIRANIISIDAEKIINWRTQQQGGVHKLSLVVIRESVEEGEGFGLQYIEQYRVLKLVESIYCVEIWRQLENVWVVVESFQPTDGKGKLWNVIPLTFIGAENNDTEIDAAPLNDLALLNLAHYRNSADYEDSTFFVGQVQPWISGLTEEWRDNLEESGIYVGSRTPILLPEGGAFGFAQAQPNSLVKEAMDQKERQMIALGARLVERGQAVKTATEAQADNEAQHSVLSLVASNVSEAYTLALQFVSRFMNTSETVEYTLNEEFTEHKIDAQMLTAIVATWQQGQLPSSDLWAQFRKYGLISSDKTDEEIKDELDCESAGLNLD